MFVCLCITDPNVSRPPGKLYQGRGAVGGAAPTGRSSLQEVLHDPGERGGQDPQRGA